MSHPQSADDGVEMVWEPDNALPHARLTDNSLIRCMKKVIRRHHYICDDYVDEGHSESTEEQLHDTYKKCVSPGMLYHDLLEASLVKNIGCDPSRLEKAISNARRALEDELPLFESFSREELSDFTPNGKGRQYWTEALYLTFRKPCRVFCEAGVILPESTGCVAKECIFERINKFWWGFELVFTSKADTLSCFISFAEIPFLHRRGIHLPILNILG